MSEKTVAQKLMIKPGHKILFIRPPQGYMDSIGALPAGVVMLDEPGKPADLIQMFVDSRAELEEHLDGLKAALAPKGMLWVTYHKGTSKIKTDINRDSIAAYAGSIGLEPVAIISINDNWSALRFKIVS